MRPWYDRSPASDVFGLLFLLACTVPLFSDLWVLLFRLTFGLPV